MLHITESQVRELLPMEKAIELVEEGFLHLAAAQAHNDPRRRLQLDASATLHYMPAVDLASGYLGIKVYSTHPQTGAHFTVLLYAADGRPLASIEANSLGQIRTGAASGVATRCLARPDAAVVGLIGSGFQAETQLEAVAKVRPIREARVFSRSAERRGRFAARMSASLGFPITAVESGEQAIRNCDIAITATNARDPVLLGEWLEPGMHINAAGSNHARRRELDAAAVGRASRIVADSVEQSKMESGELIAAFAQRPSGWDRVVELADVLAGKAPGRVGKNDITLFKSNGLAIEDIAVGGYVYQQVVDRG
ncbi:MAG TPA: ornithine cyclodeaminase family protein [Bryobacterales bacterium]|nr:ornithine cyclodeaminase family protein [Bryobacterales bacterium]